MPERKHALYRFFGPDGELLYVGITMNPAARWPKHAATKQWWHDVEIITVETFDSRSEALDAERDAIKAERPLHNIVHAEPRRANEIAPAPSILSWVCDECEEAIHGKEGALWVSLAEAHEYGTFLRDLRDSRWTSTWRSVDLGALLAGPEAAAWRSTHDSCQGEVWIEDLEPIYAVGVDRLQTPADLLGLTAHLLGKKWLRDTNWDSIISRAATRGGVKC